MTNRYSLVFCISFFVAFLSLSTTEAQNIQLYSQDFSAQNPNVIFNDTSFGGGSGINQWIINNEYSGQPLYSNTYSQDSTVSGTIGGAPYSKYLHIHDSEAANSQSIANANYDASEASDRFVVLGGGFCTLAMHEVKISFFYLGQGSTTAYAELYYSADGGAWTQVGPTLNNQNKWKYIIIEDQAFDDVANLRFGFRWINDAGTPPSGSSFAVDDIIAVGTYDPVNFPIDINVTNVIPSTACQEDNVYIFFSLSEPMCYGNYQAEISDANGNFSNATNFGYTFSLNGTSSGLVNLPLPVGLPPGNCYQIRVIRTDPAPQIVGVGSACIVIEECPNIITTMQPVVTMDTNAVCISSAIDVPFTSTGVYEDLNIYWAELSDSSGSFDNPTIVGATPSSEAYPSPFMPGNVSGLIPNVPPGCNYYIRVVSDFPAATGTPWGPFCIGECDITSNQTIDIKACIGQTFGVDTTVVYEINEFDSTIIYTPGNEFALQVLSTMDLSLVNMGGLGLTIDTLSGSFTISIPQQSQLALLGIAPGNYYARIVASNSNAPDNTLGTIIRLTIGAPDEDLDIIQNPDTAIICEDNSMLFSPTPYDFNSTYYWIGDFTGSPFEATSVSIFFNVPNNNFVMQLQEDNFGCLGPIASAAGVAVLPSSPSAIISGPNIICKGDTINYTAPFNDLTFYTWAVNGGTVLDTSNNTLTVVWDSTGQNSINLQVLNACGNNTNNKSIIVKDYPEVDAGNDTTVCQGEEVTLSTIEGNYNYTWSDDNSVISNLSTTTVTPDSTTTYYIASEITGAGDCTSHDTTTVFVDYTFEADFGDTICIGDEITLIASVDSALYQWSNGESSQSITVSDTGFYQVTITTDTSTCNSYEYFYVIGKTCSIELPNVFTPNGDGPNDFFAPFQPGTFDDFLLQVFNRWGRLVYETTDSAFQWDGTSNAGKELKAGTYYYVVRTELSGAIEEKKGTITLIR